jgi:hypothetical protein
METIIKYLKNPIILSSVGALIYYLIERFDCYINARKTTSLNRRTISVFVILVSSTYFLTLTQESNDTPEMLTDMGNF